MIIGLIALYFVVGYPVLIYLETKDRDLSLGEAILFIYFTCIWPLAALTMFARTAKNPIVFKKRARK